MTAEYGPNDIGSERWLRERFPDKDWHHHPRSDGGTDLCDGTPSDCDQSPANFVLDDEFKPYFADDHNDREQTDE